MKKRMNIIFFGLCFLASLLAEGFCFQVLKGEWISTTGISIVVIITGYLFMDSVRSLIKTNVENLKFYMDRNLREETERWSERYTEIVNLQKATYTATKKNTVMITEQISKVVSLLQEQENNSTSSRQALIDLQKKAMEGQKNALNMQIHYNKENTKQLMDVIRTEKEKTDVIPHLERVLELLDVNNDLLKNYIDKLSSQLQESRSYYNDYKESTKADDKNDKGYEAGNYDIEDYENENYDIENYDLENLDIKNSGIRNYDAVNNDIKNNGSKKYSEENNNIKNNHVVKENMDIENSDIENSDIENRYIEDSCAENSYKENSYAENSYKENSYAENNEEITQGYAEDSREDEAEEDYHKTAFLKDEVSNGGNWDDDMLTEQTLEEEQGDESNSLAQSYTIPMDIINEYTESDEASYNDAGLEEAIEEPGFNAFYTEDTGNKNVKPLYSDPNKALTTDEIAALFASAGL